ncbi:hypothetical protein PVAND_012200 [Polypedilum vanderplanki]|uniref:SREBP regulating gene protein n=1 Tax=Polypedilum vanderplanki TaxID=319348 RepID=A0A9J6CKW4_POLVA|nr:hypothetical protein PVAND_012200 [Polypedilum vanderplanki]
MDVNRILCFFRKRVVLSLIFLFSLAYFLLQFNALQLIKINRKFQDDDIEFEEISIKRESPLIWRSLKEYNLTENEICRNSQQGINLIVDERGFICLRDNLKATGCCDIQAEQTHIYFCDTCDANCCEIYENCVSCCLNPDNVPILQKAIAQASDRQKLLFSRVTDQFDLCLSICRSNSNSVVNEHYYKSSKRHCFTKTESSE